MPPFPELKDISPPTPPPFSSPEEVQALVWQVFGGVTVLLLLAAAWLWWRWSVRRAKAPPLPKRALDQLRDRLTAVQSQAATMAPAALGEEVSHAIRSYLHREHGLLARYRTTEELFGTSRGPRRADAPPPLPFLRPFAEVFPLCDTLKFAGAATSGEPAARLIDRALAATEEVRLALASRVATPAPPLRSDPAPAAMPPPLPGPPPEPAFAVGPPAAGRPPSSASSMPAAIKVAGPPPLPLLPAAPPGVLRTPCAGPPSTHACPRSDSFTRPQTAAFARGADIIPT